MGNAMLLITLYADGMNHLVFSFCVSRLQIICLRCRFAVYVLLLLFIIRFVALIATSVSHSAFHVYKKPTDFFFLQTKWIYRNDDLCPFCIVCVCYTNQEIAPKTNEMRFNAIPKHKRDVMIENDEDEEKSKGRRKETGENIKRKICVYA